MKAWHQAVIQFVLLTMQGVVANHLLPEKVHVFLTVVLSSAQAVLGIYGHFLTPSGLRSGASETKITIEQPGGQGKG